MRNVLYQNVGKNRTIQGITQVPTIRTSRTPCLRPLQFFGSRKTTTIVIISALLVSSRFSRKEWSTTAHYASSYRGYCISLSRLFVAFICEMKEAKSCRPDLPLMSVFPWRHRADGSNTKNRVTSPPVLYHSLVYSVPYSHGLHGS
jgi:hypothetical protein